jgi:hypothetical protein
MYLDSDKKREQEGQGHLKDHISGQGLSQIELGRQTWAMSFQAATLT